MNMTRIVSIVISVLCLIHVIAATEDETLVAPCKRAEPADRKSCFVDRNLSLADMPQNLDPLNPLYAVLESTLTMMDPAVHCQDAMKYREAARCAVNVSQSCHDPNGTRGLIMDADQVVAGMQVLCNKRAEVNMACFKTFYMMVMECSNYHRNAGTRPPNTVNTPCSTDDLMYDCMEVLMAPMCGMNTTMVFLEQMDKYTVPPLCVNGSNPARQRNRYFVSLEKRQENNENGAATPLAHILLLLTLVTMATGVWLSNSI